jgi:hypothetical protein
MTMESVKKELKNKKNLLERLKKSEEEEKNKIETAGSSKNIRRVSQINIIENIGTINKDSMPTNSMLII